MVAPLAGAWIEIALKIHEYFLNASLPLRERGLKSGLLIYCVFQVIVAPLAGAWIEMPVLHTR